MRRTPLAVVTAHQIDPERRELYVEGPRDRIFLNWLVQGTKSPHAVVLEVDAIEVPSGPWGAKGRLLRLARFPGVTEVQIKVLVDSDFARICGEDLPAGVWMTDYRDMESYILRPECLEKVLRNGLCDEHLDPDRVLGQALQVVRPVAAARLLSYRDNLHLPFQKTRLDRYLTLDSGDLVLARDRYLQALMQNAGLSLAGLPQVQGKVDALMDEFGKLEDYQVIHGKDAIVAVTCILRSRHRISVEEVERLLWTSFERRWANNFASLSRVAEFLETG